MTAGYAAKGTFLIWNYRKVLKLTSIKGPSEKADSINFTSHDSPDDHKEFIAGLRDGGEVPIEGHLDPLDAGGQIAFHTDIQSGTKRTCWVIGPPAVGIGLNFDAIGQGFSPSFPHDIGMGLSGSLKIAGKPILYRTPSTGLSALIGIEENGGAALTITPTPAAGTYAYACTVNTASDWVKLTVTAGSHTVYIQGVLEATGVQSDEVALGAAGTTTDILIIVYEANKAPRLYTLTVTRPAA